MRNIIIFIVVILTSILLITPAYAAGPWKGKIIDIETKEPLEGAVVLAVWYRAYRTPAGDNTYFYNSREVLTNKEGRFEISAYTPINLLPILSYLKGPHFTFFKPEYLGLSDTGFGDFFLEGTKEIPLERKHVSGKIFRLSPGVIELPMLNTRKERRRMIRFPTSIPDDKMPKLIELINKEAVLLGIKPSHLPEGSK
jgi:hypothetical protein